MSAVPLRSGDDADFAALRRELVAAGYTEAGLCAALEIPSVYAFKTALEGRPAPEQPGDALSALVHLLMDARPLARDVLVRLAPPALVERLEAFGLLAPVPDRPHECMPTVLLYPTEDLYIVSDLDHDPLDPARGTKNFMPADAVYPAITPNTGAFLGDLPRTPAKRLLDLCAGTGIAAFVLADCCEQAWAADITERATVFARFNARLNGITNVSAVQGDLYDAVPGATFDRIVAHPPYMPALEQEYVYRDGGQDGEQITRRIVEGLPAHLEPGGIFGCMCLITDRRDAPVEQRVRAMLGDAQAEFDVFAVATAASSPAEYYGQMAARGSLAVEQAMRHQQLLAALGVESLVMCTLQVRRHERERQPLTIRRQRGPGIRQGHIRWLAEWETAAADPTLPARLTAARPRVSGWARLEVQNKPVNGAWEPESCALHVNVPFPRVINVPRTVADFVAGCDGSRTIAELCEAVKVEGLVPPTMTAPEFAATLLPLIGNGVLEIDEFAIPAPVRRVGAEARLGPP